jgi:hypothetical protein
MGNRTESCREYEAVDRIREPLWVPHHVHVVVGVEIIFREFLTMPDGQHIQIGLRDFFPVAHGIGSL